MTKMPQAYMEARRADILDAARIVFVRKGFDRATMQDVASQVGLSAGALYRYFADKDALIGAVFEECEGETRQLFAQAAAAGAGRPLHALEQSGRLAWQQFADPRASERFALQLESTLAVARSAHDGGDAHDGLRHDGLRRNVREIIEQLATLARAAQAEGELAPAVDADAVALVLLSCFHGLQQLSLLYEEEVNTAATLEALIAMLHGLRPADAGEVLRGT